MPDIAGKDPNRHDEWVRDIARVADQTDYGHRCVSASGRDALMTRIPDFSSHKKMKDDMQRTSIWIGLLAALILITRAPERIVNGFMWAEDAPRFLGDAYGLGFESIFHPYAGYLHLIPRIISLVSACIFGIHSVPYVFVDSALVVSVLISIYLFRASVHFPWRRYPVVLSGLLALSPWLVPNNEVFLTVTNLQWVLAPAFMMLLWECWGSEAGNSLSPKIFGLRIAGIVLLTLTGPVCILLMPIAGLAFLWRMRRSPTSQSAILFVVYSLGTIVQAAVYLATRDPAGERSGVKWIHETVTYLIGPALAPQPLLEMMPMLAGTSAVVLLLCLLAGGIKSGKGWVLACLFYVFLATWSSSLLHADFMGMHFSWYGIGARYTYLPEVAMFWAMLVIIGAARLRAVIHTTALLAVLMLQTGATHYALADGGGWSLVRKTNGFELKVPPGWVADLVDGRIRIRE